MIICWRDMRCAGVSISFQMGMALRVAFTNGTPASCGRAMIVSASLTVRSTTFSRSAYGARVPLSSTTPKMATWPTATSAKRISYVLSSEVSVPQSPSPGMSSTLFSVLITCAAQGTRRESCARSATRYWSSTP
ncbi:MAG: hypothetical protein IPM70_18450 [Proteobacteria bacterium]|nr:hypothetical protein [Pseudomonadota bacterium]